MFNDTIKVELQSLSPDLDGCWIQFRVPTPKELVQFDEELTQQLTQLTDSENAGKVSTNLMVQFLEDRFISAYSPKDTAKTPVTSFDFANTSFRIVKECFQAITGQKRGSI